MNIDTSVWY